MSNVDTRQINRDSLFLMAVLRLDGEAPENTHRVKVRNLSAGGMMAEGNVQVLSGALVKVKLRNADWIDGTVAWKQGNRFGIAFSIEIDPLTIRSTSEPVDITPRFVRNADATRDRADPERLRKI